MAQYDNPRPWSREGLELFLRYYEAAHTRELLKSERDVYNTAVLEGLFYGVQDSPLYIGLKRRMRQIVFDEHPPAESPNNRVDRMLHAKGEAGTAFSNSCTKLHKLGSLFQNTTDQRTLAYALNSMTQTGLEIAAIQREITAMKVEMARKESTIETKVKDFFMKIFDSLAEGTSDTIVTTAELLRIRNSPRLPPKRSSITMMRNTTTPKSTVATCTSEDTPPPIPAPTYSGNFSFQSSLRLLRALTSTPIVETKTPEACGSARSTDENIPTVSTTGDTRTIDKLDPEGTQNNEKSSKDDDMQSLSDKVPTAGIPQCPPTAYEDKGPSNAKTDCFAASKDGPVDLFVRPVQKHTSMDDRLTISAQLKESAKRRLFDEATLRQSDLLDFDVRLFAEECCDDGEEDAVTNATMTTAKKRSRWD